MLNIQVVGKMTEKSKKLIISIGGPLTVSRKVHTMKIPKIVDSIFTEILIVHEGCTPLRLNKENNKVKVIFTNLPSMRGKYPLPQRIFNLLCQELKRGALIMKYASKDDIVLFRGLFQPITLILARFKNARTISFCGGFAVKPHLTEKLRSRVWILFKWALQATILKLFHALLFESPSVISYYNLHMFRQKAFDNAHLFVDEQLFAPKIPLAKRKYDIGYIGALSTSKGISYLIESLHLITKCNRLKVLIIGNGVLRENIIKKINDYEIEEFVDMKKRIPNQYMPSWYNKIKLLVLPSLCEGLPNVVIEAMACGTPVLATPVGGVPDLIRDGSTGFLISSLQPDFLAKKIVKLLSNERVLEKIGQNARELIIREFTLAKTQERWEKIFKRIFKDMEK